MYYEKHLFIYLKNNDIILLGEIYEKKEKNYSGIIALLAMIMVILLTFIVLFATGAIKFR